jgi:hypothetical protein
MRLISNLLILKGIAKDRFKYSKERYKFDLAKTKGRI